MLILRALIALLLQATGVATTSDSWCAQDLVLRNNGEHAVAWTIKAMGAINFRVIPEGDGVLGAIMCSFDLETAV